MSLECNTYILQDQFEFFWHIFFLHCLCYGRKHNYWKLLKIDSKLIIFTYWNWVWDILRERANFTHIFIWRKTKLVAALHLKALKWIIHLEPKFEYVVSIKVFFWKLWIFSNSHQHEVCIKAETFEGTLPVHREPQTSSEKVTTLTSFELASLHARVTSIKFTKQEWVSKLSQ